MPKNTVRLLRESMLMSKAELARKAGLSALTIDRVEKGNICRMDTKRKILLALGIKLSERDEVFVEELADFEDFEEQEASQVSMGYAEVNAPSQRSLQGAQLSPRNGKISK